MSRNEIWMKLWLPACAPYLFPLTDRGSPDTPCRLTRRSWFDAFLGGAASHEESYIVMVKDRPMNRIKADLVQAFLATPDVVHTVISPTQFRAEHRRGATNPASSLLARPIKFQVDILRAHSENSDRCIHAVNFQLLSGRCFCLLFSFAIKHFAGTSSVCELILVHVPLIFHSHWGRALCICMCVAGVIHQSILLTATYGFRAENTPLSAIKLSHS